MSLFVSFEVGLGLEAFPALFAREGPHAGVDEQVLLQVIFVAA
jgi:hypothetical protein